MLEHYDSTNLLFLKSAIVVRIYFTGGYLSFFPILCDILLYKVMNIEYLKVRIEDLRTDLYLEMKNWKNIQAMTWSPKLQSQIQSKMEDIQDNLEWLKVAEKNVQRVEKQSRKIDSIEIQILLESAHDILESIH